MKKLAAMLVLLLALMCVAGAEETVYEGSTYSSAGYSLTLFWQEGIKPDDTVAESIVHLFFDKYPAIRETYGTNEDRAFTIYLVNTLEEGTISRTSDKGMYVSYEYVKGSAKGLNHLISLFFNKVMNGHPNPEDDALVTVLSRGLQAYTEKAYSDNPDEAVWLIPYAEGQQLTDNGQVAGAFIKWIADAYGKDIPVRLNRVLHEGAYSGDEFWINAIGNTLGSLWNEYVAKNTAE